MPRTIADKLKFYNQIETFLKKAGLAGAKTSTIINHIRLTGWDVEPHVVRHALNGMQEAKTISRWRDKGNEDTWVATHIPVVEKTVQVEERSVNLPANLTVDIVKSTGRIRLNFANLIIEVGVVDQ